MLNLSKWHELHYRKERKEYFLRLYENKLLARVEYLNKTLMLLYENKIILKETFHKRMDLLCDYEIKRITKTYKRTLAADNLKSLIYFIVKRFVNEKLLSDQGFERFLIKNPEYLQFI